MFAARGVTESPIASGVSFTSTSTSAPSRARSSAQKVFARATFSGASAGGGVEGPVLSSMSRLRYFAGTGTGCRFIMTCCWMMESRLLTKM